MIKHPTYSSQQPSDSDVDNALRIMVKLVVYAYLIISGALALVVGVVIVGMICAYLMLRTVIWIAAMLLHKHCEFSLYDTLYSLLQETRRYARQGV